MRSIENARDWQERKRPFSNSHKFKRRISNSLILDKKIKIEKIGIRLRRLEIIVSSSTKGAHLR